MTADLIIPPLAGFTFGAVVGIALWEWIRTLRAEKDPARPDKDKLAGKVDAQLAGNEPRA